MQTLISFLRPHNNPAYSTRLYRKWCLCRRHLQTPQGVLLHELGAVSASGRQLLPQKRGRLSVHTHRLRIRRIGAESSAKGIRVERRRISEYVSSSLFPP